MDPILRDAKLNQPLMKRLTLRGCLITALSAGHDCRCLRMCLQIACGSLCAPVKGTGRCLTAKDHNDIRSALFSRLDAFLILHFRKQTGDDHGTIYQDIKKNHAGI